MINNYVFGSLIIVLLLLILPLLIPLLSSHYFFLHLKSLSISVTNKKWGCKISIWGAAVVAHEVKSCLKCWHPILYHSLSPSCSNFNIFPWLFPWKIADQGLVLAPCHLCRCRGRSSWLMTSNWPSLDHCSYVGSDDVDGRYVMFPLASYSFQMSLTKKNQSLYKDIQ